MRRHVIPGLVLLASALTACGGGGGGGSDGPPAGVADILHVTTADNLDTSFPRLTWIDHPLANGNPEAVVFWTHRFSAGGAAVGTYHDNLMTVGYDEDRGRWRISNFDLEPLDEGIAFNVTIASGLSSIGRHVTESANIVMNATLLSHPDLDDDAQALALVSHRSVSGGSIRRHIGLEYGGGQWAVTFPPGATTMFPGLAFNLYALPRDDSTFVHRSTAANSSANFTRFSHPDADGNPNAHIQITVRSDEGVYHSNGIGVWYDEISARWTIYRETSSAVMPLDAVFVVRVK